MDALIALRHLVDLGPSRPARVHPQPNRRCVPARVLNRELTGERALLKLAVGGKIEKVRHYVEHGGRTFEVDEFLGDNAGLVVAELELDDAAAAYERPDWLGEEVTDEARYYNLALASRPYSTW